MEYSTPLLPPDVQQEWGSSMGPIHLSVGIECMEDLLANLEQDQACVG